LFAVYETCRNLKVFHDIPVCFCLQASREWWASDDGRMSQALVVRGVSVDARGGTPAQGLSAPLFSAFPMRCRAPNPRDGSDTSSGDKRPSRRGTHTPRAVSTPYTRRRESL